MHEEGPGLLIKDLTILTPNSGHVLFENLNLQLAAGDSLLVMGPSGCGKSSLLRAIAGLWRRGSGIIQGPLQSDSFFLPQKPYMPLGSLREQLHFPAPKNALESYNLNDGKLMEALEEVSLEDLLERVGNLSAVLDEASSALDARNEARLYSILHAKIESYVSVGHRSSLVKYHTHVLEFKDDSSWQLFTRDEFENSKPRL
jgi:putative ATP-binding cassette transporter